MKFKSLFSSLLLAGSFLAQADEIHLKDGSKVMGTITQIHKNQISVSTKFAGDITIPTDEVTSYTTDKDQNVEFEDKQKLVGKVKFDGKDTQIIRNEVEPVKVKNILSLWDAGTEHPDFIAPVDPWSYKAYLNLTKSTGNTHEESLAGGAVAERKEDNSNFKVYFKFDDSKNTDQDTGDTNRNSQEYILGADYENIWGKKKQHSIYLRSEAEKDNVEGVDMRFTIAAGYGHYFMNQEDISLRVRTGLSFRSTSFREVIDPVTTNDITPDNSNDLGMDFGLAFKKSMGAWADWYTDVTYTPTFEDVSDFILKHESGIRVPLDVREGMKLALHTGVQHDYNEKSAKGIDDLDTTYFLRLVLSF
jgi:putative salt-induced outer membrane protein YdiY